MTNQVLAPPVWVDKPHLYKQMLADLVTQSRVAVDTESNSLHAYREQVCLIQFSTRKTDYVVDPLALHDLHSLGPIFNNPRIEKIFHAAEYDLICLRRDFGFEFSNLFDTMHAARVLGYPYVGLDNLLAEKFQFEMDKRHQKADWAVRPLTPAQLDYARLDTHFLFDLRNVLEAELKEKDRMQIAREDFARACHIDLPEERVNGTSWRRFSLRKDVTPRELTVLNELCISRDRIAKRMNRPVFKVISDALLLDIARNLPEKDVDLAGLGLSSKQIRLWGSEVLEAIKRGAVAPLVEREPARRPHDAMLKRLQKLKNWRKRVAEELKVESDIVLPKAYLNRLAEQTPKSLKELEAMMNESPTRFKKYGEQIFRLLGG
jgi:ribonuclease D